MENQSYKDLEAYYRLHGELIAEFKFVQRQFGQWLEHDTFDEAVVKLMLNSNVQATFAALSEIKLTLMDLEMSGSYLRHPAAAMLRNYVHYIRYGMSLSEATLVCAKLKRLVENFQQVKVEYKPNIAADIECDMVFIKGGTFLMGSDEYDSEKPIHSVTLNSFYLCKYQVTQKQWTAIMGNNPSHFKGEDLPVEKICWDDIQEFLKKLNAKTGKNYRLPTEAEWEYAAKGGQNYKYAGSDNLDEVGWYYNNNNKTANPVGQKLPNGYGLYDMSGNVWEWCQDVWHDNYNGAPTNGSAWTSDGDVSRRVLRGGSWNSHFAHFSRVQLRNRSNATYRSNHSGFRLARD